MPWELETYYLTICGYCRRTKELQALRGLLPFSSILIAHLLDSQSHNQGMLVRLLDV